MAQLTHIAFDNSSRLSRDVYYFEYNKIRYKLIQNKARKWSDVLIVIVGDGKSRISKEMAYSNAGEFLSALGWENDSRIKLCHAGGPGIHDGYTLRKAKCRSFQYPQIPFSGYIVGYSIDRIPKIENENQKKALTLFREAFSSNNNYLSFLFYWQILETGKTDAIGWLNKTYKQHIQGLAKFYLERDFVNRLPLGNESLGNYLNDDFRNAIAHIRRNPGKTTLRFDDLEEKTRLAIGTHIIESFAKYYISHELQLNKYLYLVRKNGKGFPFYADEDYIKKHYCKMAYSEAAIERFKRLSKKKW